MLIPALVFGLYEAVNGSRRLLGAAIAILATAGVLVSGTRGAWIACIVVILFVVLPQLSARRRVIALVAMAAVAVAVYQVPGVAELVAERSGNAVSSGGAGRTDIWTVGLAIFEKSPIVGVGYANFPVAFTTQVILDTGVGWEWLADPGGARTTSSWGPRSSSASWGSSSSSGSSARWSSVEDGDRTRRRCRPR